MNQHLVLNGKSCCLKEQFGQIIAIVPFNLTLFLRMLPGMLPNHFSIKT